MIKLYYVFIVAHRRKLSYIFFYFYTYFIIINQTLRDLQEHIYDLDLGQIKPFFDIN